MQLKNKTILFLGSSVTYGAKAGGVSFADLMVDACGINCIKVAVSGTTLADIDENSYVSRLKKVDTKQKVDLLICQLSTNDGWKKVPLNDTEKAMRFIIEYAKETFNCPVAFYTSPYFDAPKYVDLIGSMYELQKEYGFAVLDLYNDEEMSAVSEEDHKRYMADNVHPTLTGYKEWWLPKFIKFCEEL